MKKYKYILTIKLICPLSCTVKPHKHSAT